ncbi:hypothetical protein [Marinitenerispora sediminis]|uniref:non-specific serine/threonine protein kinase n=1 Tax=Marinitenerispora sediminis TaxID=1931232 RepID=A0A368T632_9ACTN|nr:hypothetical protein [Marinitenerispora sediminis]RCV53244.1 hypothetical protein DEF28_10940 [Marinitenerispora sediminis]RCV54943.1 hypothetical protein DEF23_15085 [Marinitenerispora sediminis]RCV59066.1 hypothetical protein DEF24_11220 [Marinitenerispora sediminis]
MAAEDDLPVVPGYRVTERLPAGVGAERFRAHGERGGERVLLRVLRPADGGPAAADGRPAPYAVVWEEPPDSFAALLGRQGPLPVEQVVEAGLAIGAELESLHEGGLVHNDVRPETLLIRGASAELSPGRDVSCRAGELFPPMTVDWRGFAHVPPEAFRGGLVSPRADVYRLASTLWTLLAGHPPFADGPGEEPEPGGYRDRAAAGTLPDAPRDDVPAGLAAVLRTAMAREPHERHRDAADFARALAAARTGGAAGSRPPAAASRVPEAPVPAPGATAPEPGEALRQDAPAEADPTVGPERSPRPEPGRSPAPAGEPETASGAPAAESSWAAGGPRTPEDASPASEPESALGGQDAPTTDPGSSGAQSAPFPAYRFEEAEAAAEAGDAAAASAPDASGSAPEAQSREAAPAAEGDRTAPEPGADTDPVEPVRAEPDAATTRLPATGRPSVPVEPDDDVPQAARTEAARGTENDAEPGPPAPDDAATTRLAESPAAEEEPAGHEAAPEPEAAGAAPLSAADLWAKSFPDFRMPESGSAPDGAGGVDASAPADAEPDAAAAAPEQTRPQADDTTEPVPPAEATVSLASEGRAAGAVPASDGPRADGPATGAGPEPAAPEDEPRTAGTGAPSGAPGGGAEETGRQYPADGGRAAGAAADAAAAASDGTVPGGSADSGAWTRSEYPWDAAATGAEAQPSAAAETAEGWSAGPGAGTAPQARTTEAGPGAAGGVAGTGSGPYAAPREPGWAAGHGAYGAEWAAESAPSGGAGVTGGPAVPPAWTGPQPAHTGAAAPRFAAEVPAAPPKPASSVSDNARAQLSGIGRLVLGSVLTASLVIAVLGGVALFVASRQAEQPAPSPNVSTPATAPDMTELPPEAGVNPELAPTGAELALDTGSTVRISWQDNAQGRAEYYVVGGPLGTTPQTLARAEQYSTQVEITGLNPSVDYCFTVMAIVGVDEIAPSEEVCTDRSQQGV